MEVSIVFPNQLFAKHPALDKKRTVVLVEEWLFFKQYSFHKQKLALHRASMQYYKHNLEKEKYHVNYIPSTDETCDIRLLVKELAKKKVQAIHVADPVDDWLNKRLNNACKKQSIQLCVYDSPAFIDTKKEGDDFFKTKQTYFQTDFYKHQRTRKNILVQKNGKPVGNKWTFDTDNRKKFPPKEKVPVISLPEKNEYVDEAFEYIEKNFPGNYGQNGSPFSTRQKNFYPVNTRQAEDWLQAFFEQRFDKFGVYEDAMVAQSPVLYHGVLTPMLNTGLLQPAAVIEKALQFADKNNIPLNSLEGFIRQIMGWREFIRHVYEREGAYQRTRNYWNFSRKIPVSFWQGTTGIEPVDIVIQRLQQSGYCHHIERLMVLGNFMLLCEFHPDEVYRWFMEMFIDSYDWVMVPNVYGMTQFADGGLMTTKPYISSSNYLIKMGNWKKGEWQHIWDGLFWRFMHVHRSFFEQNPRLGMLLKTWDKMPDEKKKTHLNHAKNFLAHLSRES